MRITTRATWHVTWYAIPVAHYTILVARNGLKTVSIIEKILEQFQESMVKFYRD